MGKHINKKIFFFLPPSHPTTKIYIKNKEIILINTDRRR